MHTQPHLSSAPKQHPDHCIHSAAASHTQQQSPTWRCEGPDGSCLSAVEPRVRCRPRCVLQAFDQQCRHSLHSLKLSTRRPCAVCRPAAAARVLSSRSCSHWVGFLGCWGCASQDDCCLLLLTLLWGYFFAALLSSRHLLSVPQAAAYGGGPAGQSGGLLGGLLLFAGLAQHRSLLRAGGGFQLPSCCFDATGPSCSTAHRNSSSMRGGCSSKQHP